MKTVNFTWKCIEKLKLKAENSDINIELHVKKFINKLTKNNKNKKKTDHTFYK